MLRNSHARVLLAALAFTAIETWVVLSGRADNGALSDDAFYYFQIARHAAMGRGFSFDGVFPTNGFHPLLAWIAVPVFRCWGSTPWLPIRMLQWVLVASAGATGYVLFRLGRTLVGDRAGELMAAFFFISPFTWVLPLRGCEGPLSVLCIAVGAWQLARVSQGARHLRDGATLGVLLGAALLARTENVLWAAAVAAWLVWRAPRLLIASGTAALVVVAPWLFWTERVFGSVVQVSGAAKTAFHLFNPLPAVSRVPDISRNVFLIFEHATQFVTGEEFRPVDLTPLTVAASAVLVLVAVVSAGRRRVPDVLLPLGGLLVLHLGYYAFIQRSYFNWYFLPVVLCGAVFQGERVSRAARWVTAFTLGLGAVLSAFTLAAFADRYPLNARAAESDVAPILEHLSHVPPGDSVGAWNAGRIGYFGEWARPDLQFFNLDCVVNNRLFEAWRAGTYAEWVRTNVGWLVEEPQGPFRGEPVAAVEGPLSRVVRSAAALPLVGDR
jgi:hypothetical protein